MTNRNTVNFFTALLTFVLILGVAACGGSDSDTTTQPAAEQDDHEHGEDTHMHEPSAADTAGTYVDTTGAALFDEEPEGEDGDHEHGEDSHTHE